MATNDELKAGIRIGTYIDDSTRLAKDLQKHVKGNVFFLCIGTDRATGDSLGPLIGTMLEEKGYSNVLGTIDDPVHAQNLDVKIKEIPDNTVVVAIDAALGKYQNVGKIFLAKGKLLPGAALGKELTPVGDFHISGIVNASGFREYQVLSTTRLAVVMKMAKTVANSIEQAYPLRSMESLKSVK